VCTIINTIDQLAWIFTCYSRVRPDLWALADMTNRAIDMNAITLVIEEPTTAARATTEDDSDTATHGSRSLSEAPTDINEINSERTSKQIEFSNASSQVSFEHNTVSTTWSYGIWDLLS
jgi:hypothetical protein